MMQSMSHEEAQELLATEALDALMGGERDALLAHVQGCAECSAQLARLRDTAASLAEALPIVPLNAKRSAAIRSRLIARAAADLPPRRGGGGVDVNVSDEPPVKAPGSPIRPLEIDPVHASGRSPASRGGWYAAAVAVVLAAGLLAVLRSARRDASIVRNELAAVRTEGLEVESRLALRDSLIEQLTGVTVRIVSLTADGPGAPVGWLWWDQNDKWTLLVHDMRPVTASQTYQLWVTTPGQRKLSVGTFATDHRGHAVFRAALALPRDSLAAVTVTLEPAGGAAQPAGPIALSGEAK